MKKLSVSLLTIICAFVGAANGAASNTQPINSGNTGFGTITGWGNNTTVASAWGTLAQNYQSDELNTVIETGFCTSDTNQNCELKEHQDCGYVDTDNCKYNIKEKMTVREYRLSLATDNLFSQVLNTLEREAQANYNAKLTEEQNMCKNANSGGIMGKTDMTSTYRWVKLKKNKVPKSYATAGLTDKDIDKSNDLYGSFCAARVTLQSDDADIQEAIRKGTSWSTTYFAVGDVFTCGSWIPQSSLETIAKEIAEKKYGTKNQATKLTTSQKWWLAGATVLGTGIGGVGADLLQTNSGVKDVFGAKPSEADMLFIKSSKAKAEAIDCSPNGKVSMSGGRTIAGVTVYSNIKAGTTGDYVCEYLDAYVESLDKLITKFDSEDTQNWWQRSGRRGTIDTVAAAGTGLLSFFATRDTMEARNAEEWDADTKAAVDEFMANVGSHIFCFIGAEEAGTFGDVVEIGMGEAGEVSME